MAEKDVLGKRLENYNDVFADIVNGLIFEGRSVVQEHCLEDMAVRTAYQYGDRLREQERDVVKRWTRDGTLIAICGLENQTKAERYMPVRVIGYEGQDYRGQLNRQKGEGTTSVIAPVFTLVLNFSWQSRWNSNRTLYECMSVSEELKPYVNDYHINVFDIAWLEP